MTAALSPIDFRSANPHALDSILEGDPVTRAAIEPSTAGRDAPETRSTPRP